MLRRHQRWTGSFTVAEWRWSPTLSQRVRWCSGSRSRTPACTGANCCRLAAPSRHWNNNYSWTCGWRRHGADHHLRHCSSSSIIFLVPLYRVAPLNINRFTNLFHCQNQKKICNIAITKIRPHLKCVATLPCEMCLKNKLKTVPVQQHIKKN